MEIWGYERVEEILWVKTNQLQRLIRTGRTGHWLNHSKEHCLVGVPGGGEGLDIASSSNSRVQEALLQI